MYVKGAKCGEMCIKFSRPLKIVGCDELNIYLQDDGRQIGGLPYIRIFSKQWEFIDAFTGCDVCFEWGAY